MFFKKMEDPDKKAMREDFEGIVNQLRTAPVKKETEGLLFSLLF